MNDYSNWINSLLKTVEEEPSPAAINLIQSCGKGCAVRRGVIEGMKKLRVEASGCKNRSDYANFLRKKMPIKIVEDADGIILHLGKEKCTCPMASEVTNGALCNCTCGHEKTAWSVFFGKDVDVEIIESHLRGGNDCVIKILI